MSSDLIAAEALVDMLMKETQRLERFIEKQQEGFDKLYGDQWAKIDKLNHQIQSCTCGVVIRSLLPTHSKWVEESEALIEELSTPEEFTEKSLNRLHELTEAEKGGE